MDEEGGFAASKLGTKDYWDSCYQTENVKFDDKETWEKYGLERKLLPE